MTEEDSAPTGSFDGFGDTDPTATGGAAGAGDFLRTELGSHSVTPQPSDRIGGYSIRRAIASGGMGTVYQAVQEQPHRNVALKVMKAGITSRSALRRFEFEAQTLARLRHPNIAQIYEAGTHDDGAGGVPFFAMEYVPGALSIVEYAERKHLAVRDRIAIFAKVCDAVQHGHQKGIIHRDLKPSNILVDADGEPKIIDFGVARATDSDLAVTTLQTDVGQLVGTLQYMSPEQCNADPHAIDTRSDVYALGVILYELLCGGLPYDITRTAIHEAVRVILEQQPSIPSAVNRTLRGDVETITLKAMEKDRDRRYRSAEALADDLRRYLNDEPILARPPSMTYQLSRFARRHRTLVIGVAAAVVIMIGGIVATSLALARALKAETLANERLVIAEEATARETTARETAEAALDRAEDAEAEATARADELEQVARFQSSQLTGIDVPAMADHLRETVLAEAREAWERGGLDEPEQQRRASDLADLLGAATFTDVALASLQENVFDPALTAINADFMDQPVVRAQLLQSLSETVGELGLYELAFDLQRTALELRRRELGNEHLATLQSINHAGKLLVVQQRTDEAVSYFRESMETSRRVLGEDHPDTLRSINNLGATFYQQGKFAEAEPLLRDSLETTRRVYGAEHPDTLKSLNNLGSLLWQLRKMEDAEAVFRESLEVSRSVRGDEDPETLVLMENLAALLQSQGRIDEADPLYREALASRRRIHGDDHPRTLNALAFMGRLVWLQGELDEAEAYYREALDARRRVLGDDHRDTQISILNLAVLHREQGRLSESEALFAEVVASRRRTLGDEHPMTVNAIGQMGVLLRDQGRLDEAESLLEEMLGTARRTLGDENGTTFGAIRHMGILRYQQGRFDEAETLLLESYGIAERVFEGALREQKLPGYMDSLIDVYDAWEKPEEAQRWRDRRDAISPRDT